MLDHNNLFVWFQFIIDFMFMQFNFIHVYVSRLHGKISVIYDTDNCAG